MAAVNYGALKTLVLTLTASLATRGVSVAFGEENVSAQEFNTPTICIVPSAGSYKIETPAYAKDQDPDRQPGWALDEMIDIVCWGYSDAADATPIDHADATENLRAYVLQSLFDQRETGLYYVPVSEKWAFMQDAQNRYGRGLVITVRCEISVLNVPSIDADVDEVDATVAIES